MSEEARAEFCGEVIRYMRAHTPTRRSPDVIRIQGEERPDDMADLLVTLHPKGLAGCTSFDVRL